MASVKEALRSFERTRAANIVAEYENHLRIMLTANPKARNAQDVEVIIQRLARIRRDIMGSMPVYTAPIKRDPGGDFSQDEIEAAMDFLAKEEGNPFDV